MIKQILNTIPRPWLIRMSYLFIPFSRLFYYGKRYECPVCKGTFRKFLPYGYGNLRANALCPGCLSLERHRLMWLYLQNKTQFFSQKQKVLHIAPEQSFLKRFRKMKNLDYSTADLFSPLADYRCDVQKLPFEKENFDLVICNHVLEHVDNDQLAMSEILRVLKPGGYAILQVPVNFSREHTFEDMSITDPRERARIFGQYDHVRVYGRDYPDLLRRAGFIIDEESYTHELSDELKERYSVKVSEFMFACKKAL
ncbi:MAG: methyltransferase domain-containing protein [Bacteroidota bacterium]|nr:MAG: methyltransferase domain-containing protein [Bacteroidota bacterium]